MSRLVMQPSVRVIASTVINSLALTEWAFSEGLMDVAMDDNTPIGRLFEAVQAEPFKSETHPGIGDASLDRLAEFAGRHCYRSWEKGRELQPYIDNIIESGHGSVLRHGTLVFAISGISRTLSLELIRHHVGADVSQESQRYVEASDIRFVVPPLMVEYAKADPGFLPYFERKQLDKVREYEKYINLLKMSADANETHNEAQAAFVTRMKSLDRKRILEAARSCLPNCAETRMVWTMNTNSMRNIVAARGSIHADLEMRRLAVEFCRAGKRYAPAIFEDFRIIDADDGFETVLTAFPKV